MKQMSEKGSVIHADAYEKYYSTHLKKYQDLDPSIEVDYYRSKFRSVMPQDRKARILEIGSGLGKFGYFLKTEGYTNFTCVDVSPEMAHLAKKHAGIDVVLVSEPMEFLARHRNEYDVVFMLDVIEH